MCFAWISEQTAIISPYSINLSVFRTEAESVYCAVRNGSLNQRDSFILRGLNIEWTDVTSGYIKILRYKENVPPPSQKKQITTNPDIIPRIPNEGLQNSLT
jgi:hypothetical protein